MLETFYICRRTLGTLSLRYAEIYNNTLIMITQESPLSLSCNLWIPNHESADKVSHVIEAATRFVFGSLLETISKIGIDTDSLYAGWFNPNSEIDGNMSKLEELCNHDHNAEILINAVKSLQEKPDCEEMYEDDISDMLKDLTSEILKPEILKLFVDRLKHPNKLKKR